MRKRNFMKWSCSTMDVNIHNVFSETLQQQTRTAVIKTIFIYPCIECVYRFHVLHNKSFSLIKSVLVTDCCFEFSGLIPC